MHAGIWDQRYGAAEFAYGTAANEFFAQELSKLEPGELLLAAEGEGRNAVFAVQHDWYVAAFDYSAEARNKALQLAKEHKMAFSYKVCSYENYKAPAGFFNCIGLIYAHMGPEDRKKLHAQCIHWLKPGGTIILEAFHPTQLEKGYTSGGPKDASWLYTEALLREDFEGLGNVQIQFTEVALNEGKYHQGMAAVIRMVAQKAL
jgi:cyclopropane fatty-acyl-phospholipid synthase-like methyltransferase